MGMTSLVALATTVSLVIQSVQSAVLTREVPVMSQYDASEANNYPNILSWSEAEKCKSRPDPLLVLLCRLKLDSDGSDDSTLKFQAHQAAEDAEGVDSVNEDSWNFATETPQYDSFSTYDEKGTGGNIWNPLASYEEDVITGIDIGRTEDATSDIAETINTASGRVTMKVNKGDKAKLKMTSRDKTKITVTANGRVNLKVFAGKRKGIKMITDDTVQIKVTEGDETRMKVIVDEKGRAKYVAHYKFSRPSIDKQAHKNLDVDPFLSDDLAYYEDLDVDPFLSDDLGYYEALVKKSTFGDEADIHSTLMAKPWEEDLDNSGTMGSGSGMDYTLSDDEDENRHVDWGGFYK